MQFKTHIKEIDEAGFITFTRTFTRDELNEIMLESYQRGYNDGLYQTVPYDIDKTDNRPPIIKTVNENEIISK